VPIPTFPPDAVRGESVIVAAPVKTGIVPDVPPLAVTVWPDTWAQNKDKMPKLERTAIRIWCLILSSLFGDTTSVCGGMKSAACHLCAAPFNQATGLIKNLTCCRFPAELGENATKRAASNTRETNLQGMKSKSTRLGPRASQIWQKFAKYEASVSLTQGERRRRSIRRSSHCTQGSKPNIIGN
jgi:hypothetical protein